MSNESNESQASNKSTKTNKNGSLNPIESDAAYQDLSKESRVVMRHAIALNLDNFKASTDDFEPRPTREYPALQPLQTPFVSLIVPNYNGRNLLPALFAALRQQTFQDFEIIFADDSSTDDSVAYVEEHYAQDDALDIRIVVNRRNLGFVANVNAAADAARGPVLVLLNTDTEPEPTWLAELAKAVCENPQAAIVTSKILLYSDPHKLHTTGDLMGLDGIPRNRGVWETDVGQYDDQRSVFGGSGGGSAFRRDVWQVLGGFDEDFWMYLEDVDYAFRAQLSGWDAVYAPAARLRHHISATSGDTLASYYVGRNTIWTIAKNMPRGLLLRNLPAIIAAQVNISLDALRNIRGEAARTRLRGQIAGVLGLPAQLQKRRVIQPRRIREDAELRVRLI